MQVRGLGISLGVGLQQHGLLIEPAGSDTYDCPAVAMVIVAKLRELLSGDKEGRLAVREPLFGLGQFQSRLPDAIQ